MYPAYNPQLTGGRIQWPECAMLASKAGFPGSDVGIGAAMKNGLEPTRKLLADNNLKPAAVGLPVEFRKDEETFRREMAGLPDAASFANAIGCPRMVTYIASSSDKPKAA